MDQNTQKRLTCNEGGTSNCSRKEKCLIQQTVLVEVGTQ